MSDDSKDRGRHDTQGFDHHHPGMQRIAGPGPEDHNSDIFFSAVETTRMPMVITNPRLPDNPIVFVNNAFIEMTGYEQHEILNQNCRFLQGPKTDPTAVSMVRTGIADRVNVSVEMLNYKKDGTPFWNTLFVSPVFSKTGELLFYFGSQLDVSRRRVAEDALRQSQKMEALGQLTGGLAHDFNNLLQVVVGHLDRTKMKLGDQKDHTVIRAIDLALQAAEKGAALTQQLLSFARKQRLDQQPMNVNELINNVRALAERTVGRDIDFQLKLADDLPSALCDPTQTEMAVLNILINARDAMPNGGTVVLETRLIRNTELKTINGAETLRGDHIGVFITDNGTGIPPEVIDRVTEPFFTTKEQGKGTGLGLSMVYGYMQQTGGALCIDSEMGKGTTLTLLFPSTGEAARHDGATLVPMEQQGQESVLVVEDQPEVMDLTATILRDAGYHVFTAINARDALKIADENPQIDAVFSDIIMPGGMNGVALAQALVEKRPKMKVLLTTGYSSDTSLNHSLMRWPVLQKPYRPSNLMQAMRDLFETT